MKGGKAHTPKENFDSAHGGVATDAKVAAEPRSGVKS